MLTDLNQANAVQLLTKRVPVGSGTATASASSVDLKDFVSGCKVVIGHTEVSTSGVTSIIYTLLDSADNTTFAASAGLPAAVTTTNSTLTSEIAIDTRQCRRYLALKYVTASTTATFDIGAFFIGCKNIT